MLKLKKKKRKPSNKYSTDYEGKEIDNNKFMKILIACGVTYEQIKDFTWYIEEIEPHKYHCNGYHPVARRISIIKENIVV